MHFLYTMKIRYAILHVELGPAFMFAGPHLRMLWADVVRVSREQRVLQVFVESRNPLRDMRVDEALPRGDFLGGLEQPGLKAAFCLYNFPIDGPTREFKQFAAALACRSRFFESIDEAVRWVGMAADDGTQGSPNAGRGSVSYLRAESIRACDESHASGALRCIN